MSTTSPEKWEKMLSSVEQMLQENLAAAAARLQDTESLADDRSAQARGEAMRRVKGYLQGLEQRLQAAATTTTEADLALAGGEKCMREYLALAEGIRQRLADWAARAIG